MRSSSSTALTTRVGPVGPIRKVPLVAGDDEIRPLTEFDQQKFPKVSLIYENRGSTLNESSLIDNDAGVVEAENSCSALSTQSWRACASASTRERRPHIGQ